LLENLRQNGFNSDEVAVGLIRLLRANSAEIPVKELLQAASAGEWKAQPAAKGGKSDGSAGRNSGETAIEQGMVRLWMNLGNRNGLRPGDIVGAIAGETGIPGKADRRDQHSTQLHPAGRDGKACAISAQEQ